MLLNLNRFRWLAFTFVGLFFLSMCILTLYRHAWATPLPKLTPQKPLILILIAVFEFSIIIAVKMVAKKLYARLGNKSVSIVLTVYTVVQILFVLLFPIAAYEDAVIVEGFAKQILSGDFSSLGIGHYLGYYPNNIGITLFFTFLYSFLPKSYITLRLVNVIFNTISVWLIYKLYNELMPEKKNNSYGVLLLSVLFMPAIILNNFTYGDIICNTFCLAAMLNALKFIRFGKLKYGVYTAVFLMLGNFMRSIALLFLFAILLYWIVNMADKIKFNKVTLSWKNIISAILLTVIIFNLPLKIFSVVGLKAGIIPEPVGIHANPVWRWINIGFPEEKRLGYWDGGRNAYIFISRFNCDPKRASEFFKNDILEKYKKIGKLNTLKSYIKKTFWLWTEGTYSVNFYGLSQAVKSENFILYKTPLVKYIEPGDKLARNSLNWLLHAKNWVFLILISVSIYNSIRRKDYTFELFAYVIIFYIGFYLLWEVKSRYLFGLYPVFIIMAYDSLSFDKIKGHT